MEGLSGEKACTDCPVDEFCACDGADILFDVDRVMEQELVDVGEGVRMTEPVRMRTALMTGDGVRVSLSHKGVLAVYDNTQDIVQLTNLSTGRQVDMMVEATSLMGFYDDKALLLTCWMPLREATVESVFSAPSVKTFTRIEGTSGVSPCTDTSLLQTRRVLYCPTTDGRLFAFNVDTRAITEADVGRKVSSVACLTGVGCNVEAVFKDNDDKCTYALNRNSTVTRVSERHEGDLTAMFPSAAEPGNIARAVLKYWDFVKGGNSVSMNRLMEFDGDSVVRVFRDVFLGYDYETRSWAVFRLINP